MSLPGLEPSASDALASTTAMQHGVLCKGVSTPSRRHLQSIRHNTPPQKKNMMEKKNANNVTQKKKDKRRGKRNVIRENREIALKEGNDRKKRNRRKTDLWKQKTSKEKEERKCRLRPFGAQKRLPTQIPRKIFPKKGFPDCRGVLKQVTDYARTQAGEARMHRHTHLSSSVSWGRCRNAASAAFLALKAPAELTTASPVPLPPSPVPPPAANKRSSCCSDSRR